QLLSFVFMSFLPGWLIIGSLKLNRLGWVEKAVLSVGLSTSFVMLFGLIINFTIPVFGYTKPLSLVPMVLSFTIAILALGFFASKENKNIISIPRFRLTTLEKALLLVPSSFPLLSILGMRHMNTTDNNTTLMILLLLIPAYVVFLSIYQKRTPERLYPAFVFLIGISILLLTSLRGNHVIGSDIHDAYFFFQTTLDNKYWSVTQPSLIESLLSISLLPSVYQVFLNTSQEYLY
ncbi:MAG TPA: hypothetical protein VJ044_15230, partial [Candidatus Hodarchaeales archaeon]|nr:hypothetical protein [Candidatus Hodarchaeales archaeon]